MFKDCSIFFRFHWEIKCHESHVNLVKHEVILKDFPMVRDIYFPVKTKKN